MPDRGIRAQGAEEVHDFLLALFERRVGRLEVALGLALAVAAALVDGLLEVEEHLVLEVLAPLGRVLEVGVEHALHLAELVLEVVDLGRKLGVELLDPALHRAEVVGHELIPLLGLLHEPVDLGFQAGALLRPTLADLLLEGFQRLPDGRLGELDRLLLLEIDALEVGFDLPGAGLHPPHVGEQDVYLFLVALDQPLLGLLELAAGQVDEAALGGLQVRVEPGEPAARFLELGAHPLHRLRFLGQALQVLVHAAGHVHELVERRGVGVDRLLHPVEIVRLVLERLLEGENAGEDLAALVELVVDIDAQGIELQAPLLDEGVQLLLGLV